MTDTDEDVIIVYKNLTTTITVNLPFDGSGDEFTSQIREDDTHTSDLIAEWDVSIIESDEDHTLLKLVIDDSVSASITQKKGYMDVRRISAGEPIPVFATAKKVRFRDSVTT